MIYCLLVFTFFTVVSTGPAGIQWRERRAAKRREIADRPQATVVYLPPGACRAPGAGPQEDPSHVCCADCRPVIGSEYFNFKHVEHRGLARFESYELTPHAREQLNASGGRLLGPRRR